MAEDPDLWQHRPLSSQLLQYAAADVSQLLNLAQILSAQLGEAGLCIAFALSQANSQMKLPLKLGTQVMLTNKLLVIFTCLCMSALCTASGSAGPGN